MAIKDNKNGSFTIDYRDYKGSRRQETIYGSKTLAKEIYAKRLVERTIAKSSPEKIKQKLKHGFAVLLFFCKWRV